MVHIYYLTIVVLVAISSSYITMNLPRLKRVFKRLLTRNKKNTPIPAINNIVIDLNARVGELEKKVNKRHNNNRQYIREEIRNVLLELKK